MPIVKGIEKLFSVEAHNKFGKNRFLGSSHFGASDFGTDDIIVKVGRERDITLTGVYSLKHLNNKRFFTRGRYYFPSNPRTQRQQEVRQVFANAVHAWQSLTDEQKSVYNERAKGKSLLGYSIFIREYILSH